MKLLKSSWGVVLIGLLMNVATSGYMSVRLFDGLKAKAGDGYGPVEGTPEHFNFFTREIDQLSNDLRDQLGKIDARELELQRLEERLTSERAELERLRKDMQVVRDQLSKVIIEVKESESKNIKELSGIYADMPPEEVVNIFGELEDDFVVKILTQMPRDAIGPIFEAMATSPENTEVMRQRVARLTEMMRMMVEEKSESKGGF
jgi:flagellar motility protein MotE (MotC chaperone)